MVGKQLPGEVVKTPCDEYDYIVPNSGEIIRLSHKYEYVAEDATAARSHKPSTPSQLKADVKIFSTNGTQQLVEAI